MNENENKNIKDQVILKIRAGEISMKPKLYFWILAIALIVMSILTFLTSCLLISFIIFSLVASGKVLLLGFGIKGFLLFFLLFPWHLLIIEIIFILILEWLIKKFRFGYRSSLSKLVFVILLISIIVSILINITPLHQDFERRAQQKELPLVGDYYREIRYSTPQKEIFVGIVSGVGTSSFILTQVIDSGESTSSQSYVIHLPPNFSKQSLPYEGDKVFVAGQLMQEKSVNAYGFQKFWFAN